MNPAQIAAVADELFAAVERGDLETVGALYAPSIEVWHCVDRTTKDRAASLAVLDWFRGRTTERRYTDVRRDVFEDGFVQQHLLVVTTTAGAVVEVPACLVVRLDEEARIIRINEYIDSASLSGLSPAS